MEQQGQSEKDGEEESEVITKALPMVLAFMVLCDARGGGANLWQIPTEAETVVETAEETAKPVSVVTRYTIHGITPRADWQDALRGELRRAGIEWYMPYAVCQIWQESRWNQYADNGKDKGITQQKEIYWFSRAQRFGVADKGIWDVGAQFRVYASMMAGYLKSTRNDIGWALSYYFYGNGQRADKYVHDVMSHMDYLKEAK